MSRKSETATFENIESGKTRRLYWSWLITFTIIQMWGEEIDQC